MYLDARAGRSWRRNRKKGVSPIIATILLVAITVVLAAVLYVLISGLTKGPGNTPLGTAYSWESPLNTTSTTSPPMGCVASDFCYSLGISSASGINTGNLKLDLKSSTGASIAFPANTKITLVNAGTNVTSYTPSKGTWLSASVPVSAGESIVINTGTAGNTGLLGDFVSAVGQGSFSGTVTTTALP